MRAHETRVSIGQVVNIGFELKRELERVAREDGRDVGHLANAIVREWLEAHKREPPAR